MNNSYKRNGFYQCIKKVVRTILKIMAESATWWVMVVGENKATMWRDEIECVTEEGYRGDRVATMKGTKHKDEYLSIKCVGTGIQCR